MRNANKSPITPYSAVVREVEKWPGIRIWDRIITKSYSIPLSTGRPNHNIGLMIKFITSDRGGGKCFCSCLFICLSVCEQDYSKRRSWIWMKCCVSTDVGTWTNWLTFEPDPDYGPGAGTGLLSPISYKRWYAEFYVGKIPPIGIGLQRRVVLRWFYSPRAVRTTLSEVHALYRVPF